MQDIRIKGQISEKAREIAEKEGVTITEWTRKCLRLGERVFDKEVYIKEDGEFVKVWIL